jgi:hypothetical protein
MVDFAKSPDPATTLFNISLRGHANKSLSFFQFLLIFVVAYDPFKESLRLFCYPMKKNKYISSSWSMVKIPVIKLNGIPIPT